MNRDGELLEMITKVECRLDALEKLSQPQEAVVRENARLREALHAINKLRSSTTNYGAARGIACKALRIVHTDSTKPPSNESTCPHATPFNYCHTCVESPCPIGLGEALKKGE